MGLPTFTRQRSQRQITLLLLLVTLDRIRLDFGQIWRARQAEAEKDPHTSNRSKRQPTCPLHSYFATHALLLQMLFVAPKACGLVEMLCWYATPPNVSTRSGPRLPCRLSSARPPRALSQSSCLYAQSLVHVCVCVPHERVGGLPLVARGPVCACPPRSGRRGVGERRAHAYDAAIRTNRSVKAARASHSLLSSVCGTGGGVGRLIAPARHTHAPCRDSSVHVAELRGSGEGDGPGGPGTTAGAGA